MTSIELISEKKENDLEDGVEKHCVFLLAPFKWDERSLEESLTAAQEAGGFSSNIAGRTEHRRRQRLSSLPHCRMDTSC